jgi:hypothetical protein
MNSLKKKPQVLTKNAFCDIVDCHCGKPVFKYHNTSKNIFILKCAYVKYEYDLKTKKWSLSKKQPCALFCVYHAERPILFKKVENVIVQITKFTEFTLEKRLRTLFRFLHVSNRTSTIQEVDLIVVNQLKREPRKVYYYPSIGLPRVSHRESFIDYETRIFSEEIVDRSEVSIPKTPSPRAQSKFKNILNSEPIESIELIEPVEPIELGDSDSESPGDGEEQDDPGVEEDLISYSDPEEEIEFDNEIEEYDDVEDDDCDYYDD